MKRLITYNLDIGFSLELTEISNTELLTRYQVQLIDIDQDDDSQNDLWVIEFIRDETYSLAYQQILINELVMFGTLTECLNEIHAESQKLIARKKSE